MARSKQKIKIHPAPNVVTAFDALLATFQTTGGSAYLIFEADELDEHHHRRWQFVNRGDPATLELMAAHVLHMMASARTRRLAEVLRGGHVLPTDVGAME